MDLTCGRFRISGGVLIALAAAYFFSAGEFLLAVAVGVAFHELGHYAAVRFFGGNIVGLRIGLTGVTMSVEGMISYLGDILTAAAGPAASLILAVLAALAGRYTHSDILYMTAGVSVVFCVFNLMPVYPLDGGRILYSAIARAAGPDRSERISCVVSCIAIFLLLVLGTALLKVSGRNYTLLAAAIWLLICYCKYSGNSIKSIR